MEPLVSAGTGYDSFGGRPPGGLPLLPSRAMNELRIGEAIGAACKPTYEAHLRRVLLSKIQNNPSITRFQMSKSSQLVHTSAYPRPPPGILASAAPACSSLYLTTTCRLCRLHRPLPLLFGPSCRRLRGRSRDAGGGCWCSGRRPSRPRKHCLEMRPSRIGGADPVLGASRSTLGCHVVCLDEARSCRSGCSPRRRAAGRGFWWARTEWESETG